MIYELRYIENTCNSPILQISSEGNKKTPIEIGASKTTDTDKHITTIDRPKIFVISSYILHFCQSCGFIYLSKVLGNLGYLINITGFRRYNFHPY